MSEDQKKQLERQLWNIANTLRGKMNADEFRDYILGFIFYKYLSEKMDIYANNILKPDGIKFTDIDENKKEGKEYIEAIREEALEKLGYFLKPSELFSEVAKRGNYDSEGKPLVAEDESSYGTASNFILEDLQKILNNVQNSTMGTESEEDFDNLFEDMDLNSTKLGKTPEARNVIIAKVLAHLDKIDFKLENTELDVLGDAYEYLIGKFASGAGKKAGEFYTPQEVSIVLAKLVTTGKKKLKSVYDPTCGSGSLLLRVAKEVDEVNNFYGQELNRTTYNLARMNMILHDVHYRKFDIKQEDTLENPQHLEHRFEAIVANPPFSAKWSANQLFMSDDRFSQYGKLAPSSKADFAFVQHMVHHLSENGQMAVVLPHGALFRGSGEALIRRYLIEEKNFLDAVIGLPANIFYGTSIPTCILVFKKCREHPNDILFIDASTDFDKVKTQNMLSDENIDRIISTYRNRVSEEKYSHVATLKEIAENEYNLNIPRYVDKFEEEEPIDIDAIVIKIMSINDKLPQINSEIESFCNQLGIKKPF
jgi:type I restriction enzyme M protein